VFIEPNINTKNNYFNTLFILFDKLAFF